MNQKNQTKESLIAAAQEFRKYRAEADRLKGERAKLLSMCERRLRGEPSTCPRFFGHSFGAKWCDACLSTKDINEKYRRAAFKATGWQRALYGWCDKLKGPKNEKDPCKEQQHREHRPRPRESTVGG